MSASQPTRERGPAPRFVAGLLGRGAGEGSGRARTPVPAENLQRFGGGAIAPFGQMLVVGLVISALSLPLITAVGALAGGTFHLEQHLRAKADSLGDLLAQSWRAIRSGWWVGLGTVGALGIIVLNMSLAWQGLIPGGRWYLVLSGALGAILAAVVCRSAALWQPGSRWSRLLRQGRDVTIDDPVGTVIVLASFGVCAVVVWMLPPLIVITPGMLAIALVAVERRRAGIR